MTKTKKISVHNKLVIKDNLNVYNPNVINQNNSSFSYSSLFNDSSCISSSSSDDLQNAFIDFGKKTINVFTGTSNSTTPYELAGSNINVNCMNSSSGKVILEFANNVLFSINSPLYITINNNYVKSNSVILVTLAQSGAGRYDEVPFRISVNSIMANRFVVRIDNINSSAIQANVSTIAFNYLVC